MRQYVRSFVYECVQARFNCWKLVKSIVCRIPIKVAVVYFYVYFYFLRLLCTVTSDEILLHWRNYTTLMSIYHAQQLQTTTLKKLWHFCLSCTTAADSYTEDTLTFMSIVHNSCRQRRIFKRYRNANTYIRRAHTHVSTCTHAYREVGWRAIKGLSCVTNGSVPKPPTRNFLFPLLNMSRYNICQSRERTSRSSTTVSLFYYTMYRDNMHVYK